MFPLNGLFIWISFHGILPRSSTKLSCGNGAQRNRLSIICCLSLFNTTSSSYYDSEMLASFSIIFETTLLRKMHENFRERFVLNSKQVGILTLTNYKIQLEVALSNLFI